MADTATLSVGVVIKNASAETVLSSLLADFSDAAVDDRYAFKCLATNGAAITPLDLSASGFAGPVTGMIVKNLDGANEVDVTWTDNDANSNTQLIPAEGFLVIPDLDPATDPTFEGDGGDVLCEVIIFGA